MTEDMSTEKHGAFAGDSLSVSRGTFPEKGDTLFPNENPTPAKIKALHVSNLRKVFGSKTGVERVDLSFDEGDFIGLLGPNGAGKTTTINMLTGLIKPTEGEISYFGMDFHTHARAMKSMIGVVPQANNLDRDLTAYENLYHHALLYGMAKETRKSKIEKILEFAGLGDYTHRYVKTFSGGTKRRLVIARALLHEPRILFLDEPTVGLDPNIRRNMWDFIVSINQIKHTTILLTTHYIEEAEKLCKRVLIINNGKIIAEGAPEQLKQGMGSYVLEKFADDRIDEMFFQTKEEALAQLKECTGTCKIREVTLEDVFLVHTGRRIDV